MNYDTNLSHESESPRQIVEISEKEVCSKIPEHTDNSIHIGIGDSIQNIDDLDFCDKNFYEEIIEKPVIRKNEDYPNKNNKTLKNQKCGGKSPMNQQSDKKPSVSNENNAFLNKFLKSKVTRNDSVNQTQISGKSNSKIKKSHSINSGQAQKTQSKVISVNSAKDLKIIKAKVQTFNTSRDQNIYKRRGSKCGSNFGSNSPSPTGSPVNSSPSKVYRSTYLQMLQAQEKQKEKENEDFRKSSLKYRKSKLGLNPDNIYAPPVGISRKFSHFISDEGGESSADRESAIFPSRKLRINKLEQVSSMKNAMRNKLANLEDPTDSPYI